VAASKEMTEIQVQLALDLVVPNFALWRAMVLLPKDSLKKSLGNPSEKSTQNIRNRDYF
jgi:hypothetical protein